MSLSSHSDRTGSVEMSGFDGLNLLDFIDVKVPGQGWPVRIRFTGVSGDNLASAKLDYIDVDGTNVEAVNVYLAENPELPLKEIDCKIDIMKLITHGSQLEVVLPNAARLIGNRTVSLG